MPNARMKNATCIEDLRELARGRVPRVFFEYVDTGSYSQETLRANRTDLEQIKLRQRVMVDVSSRDTSTTMIGEKVSLPVALAPVGLPGMVHGNGEILACRAAQAAGIPFIMSTPSICSIEDVASVVDSPFWFQLYVMKDRGFTRSLIERAAAARCTALVLTVDLPMMGQRHVDIRNGLSVPPSLKIKNLVEMAMKPRWTLSVLAGKRRTLGNFDGYIKNREGIRSILQWVGSQFDQTLSWKDVDWVRNLWPGKLIIKGILDVEDARLAAKTGATALVVSNHGGRQLDGTTSSISILPKVVDAVGSETEVLFDSGIRSGQDVLRALALGAKGCLIGRAYIYGLGAGGQLGVAKSIDIIKRELEFSMALTGVKRVSEIGQHILAQ